MTDPAPNPPPRKQGFFRVVGAVMSAFVGIRQESSFKEDRATIKPVHIIVAGIIGALIFIGTLVSLVRLVISR